MGENPRHWREADHQHRAQSDCCEKHAARCPQARINFGETVAVAMAVLAGGGDQAGDLGISQIFAAAGLNIAAETSRARSAAPTPTAGPAPPSQTEGQITELICGHPPSVMFTLKAGDEQFLFHVKDIAKIRVLDATGNAGDAASCGKWRDRKATVEFSETPDGLAFGEVSAISLK